MLDECPHQIENKNCNKRSTIQCMSGKHKLLKISLQKCFLIASPADCTNGETRLVDGPAYREGRVEVCMDGRWGTVCSDNQQLITAVCTPLGYPGGGEQYKPTILDTDCITVCIL